ncbi:SpoIIE family protein phosphatase [Streptomyces sp. NPDC048278]|uniref:ATP-binding SpoIIE family protein phosphatase n=1 Tax=Streptomyces sp. NPDC048278 TaxID=3155809 RepID=UPI003446E9F0
MRLVAASGLAAETVEPWSNLLVDRDVAPARALREGALVTVAGEYGPDAACTVVAVPLMGTGGPVGALSLFTKTPVVPTPEQRPSLYGVAAWFAGYLEGSRGRREASAPAETDSASVARCTAQDTLRTLYEAFLALDDNWQITYFNEEAERLFALGPAPLGRVLWDLPAANIPGLEDQCRRASAEASPAVFTLRLPTDGRLVHVRCVPARAGGLAMSCTDVTETGGPTDQQARESRRPADERLAAAWTSRMDGLTKALSEAVTSADIVRTVADHLLPAFNADGMGIEVLEGDRLEVVGSVGYPPGYLQQVGPMTLRDVPEVAEVLRNRAPRFIESAADFGGIHPKYKKFLATSPMKAWAFLPLATSGRVIGACFIAFRRPHVFNDDERTLVAASSGVVAQALERARLYDLEHARAQGLQRALLPKTLPSLPALSAAARYLPVGVDEEVGGDWYDVIPLSADRVAMVVGDVMGHGITEAATMGRLRTAVRTLAELEMPPDEVFVHLNELVSELGHDCFATCLYSVFDPVAQTCTFCSAGHPPPAVVHPDGTVTCPVLVPDPPLGAASPPFATHELRLPGENILAFCTDGLLEATTGDIEQGLAHLRDTLADAMTRQRQAVPEDGDRSVDFLDDLCDAVVTALMPDRKHTVDDAALLITLTRCTADRDVSSLDLPADPRAAGQARRHVREQLAVWGLEDLTTTTELVVSELVGNVIRHAKQPLRLRLLRSNTLICEVYDGSLSTPRIRRATHTDEGGRGLQMVSLLCRRWGARYLDDGKCIWAEQSLHP